MSLSGKKETKSIYYFSVEGILTIGEAQKIVDAITKATEGKKVNFIVDSHPYYEK